jgi:predicted esterase
LDVEGFNAAVVAVPVAAQEPRPVVLALHGNYDRPEWQCQVWRDVVGPRPWVLCPRGVPRSDAPKRLDRWTYAGAKKLEQEIEAALAALVAAYPKHVDAEWPVFTGFSLGAILGVRLLSRKDKTLRFRAAVLVEGGYKGWHFASAKAFAAQGGERVLFACGQSACRHAAKQASRVLSRHEVLAEIASGGEVGHTYDGQVASAIQQQWGFVIGQDSRFLAQAQTRAQPNEKLPAAPE